MTNKITNACVSFGITIIGGSLALLATATQAAENDSRFGLGIEIGAEYDDNITVDDQDLSTNQGDESLLLDADLSYKAIDDGDSEVELGYSFHQSLHEELSDFDLQIHGLSLGAKTDLGNTTLGGNYRYTHILLGGDQFLDLHTVRPYLGFSLSKELYLNVFYEFEKRNFDTNQDRDADQHTGGFVGYYFFAPKSFVSGGYKIVREKADGPQYSYWAHYFDAGLKIPFDMNVIKPIFRAHYRYYNKNFSNITPSIGEERSDKRHKITTSIEAPVIGDVTAKIQYEYTDSNSNLPSVDYSENVISLVLGWSL